MSINIFIMFMLTNTNPTWVQNPPTDSDYFYYVGEVTDIKDKDTALQKSWNSGLFRIATVEFPQLIQLSSNSRETLEHSQYERKAIEYFQLINWSGVQEVKTLGSPFVYFDKRTNGYTAYRLLRWSKAQLRASQTEASIALEKIKKADSSLKTFNIPQSPEIIGQEEGMFISALDRLQHLNNHIETKDAKLNKIMHNIKCGTTIHDIISILGTPDRQEEQYFGGIYYYWGTYQITLNRSSYLIRTVSENLGNRNTKYICD